MRVVVVVVVVVAASAMVVAIEKAAVQPRVDARPSSPASHTTSDATFWNPAREVPADPDNSSA